MIILLYSIAVSVLSKYRITSIVLRACLCCSVTAVLSIILMCTVLQLFCCGWIVFQYFSHACVILYTSSSVGRSQQANYFDFQFSVVGPRKFARFVLFRIIRKRSFNPLCVLDPVFRVLKNGNKQKTNSMGSQYHCTICPYCSQWTLHCATFIAFCIV